MTCPVRFARPVGAKGGDTAAQGRLPTRGAPLRRWEMRETGGGGGTCHLLADAASSVVGTVVFWR